ncbi:hypothetical protein [Terrimonas pollutisoli]|uniref:hypothetical protein n=1 Tax=Terrimonas pollutisoli TaxID=3034147 RepID=UPI0023EDDDB6|nr:hypothetical protein [Terrimonas sp. H1YJ31]
MLSCQKIKWLGLLMTMAIVQETLAQEKDAMRSHSFTTGISSLLVGDDYLGVYERKLKVAGIGYRFQVLSPYRKKAINVNWNKGTSRGIGLSEFEISYSDAFSIVKNKKSFFNSYVGYSVGTNPVFLKTNTRETARYSWAASTSLSLYNTTTYTWKNNSLYLELFLPVIGFASRPVRNNVYKESINGILYDSYSNISFTSWHNLRAVTASLKYAKQLSKSWGVSVAYSYNYKQMKKSYDFLEKGSGIQAAISWHLR